MSNARIGSLIFIVIVAILFSLFVVPKWNRYWEIDQCLDQSGGWDREEEVCIHLTNPGDMSPYDECRYYGGEWDSEEDVCVGAEGDPWP